MNFPRLVRFFLLCVLSINLTAFTASANPKDCPKILTQEEFFKARKLEFDRNDKLKFSEANVEFFKKNRDNLRATLVELRKKYFEVEHFTHRMMLAQMMQTHLFVYGDPGATKSGLVRELLNVLTSQPDGTMRLDVFSQALHQLMGDSQMKGYLDTEKLKFGKEITVEDIKNFGALVQCKKVLLDEIDKGNPVALAALMDILNEKIAQYGPITLKVRTKTVVATSNMTLYEFLRVFERQDMDSTARALLDRFVFKVYMHNYPGNEDYLGPAMILGDERSAAKARRALENPEDEYGDVQAQKVDLHSALPEVDWVWLGRVAEHSTTISQSDNNVLKEIVAAMRQQFNTMRRTSEAAAAEDQGTSGRPIYYPPTISSMRNIMEYVRKTVRMSVMLDVLALPENKMPAKVLVDLMQKKIPIDRFSAWRMQDVLLTAAAGDPAIEVQDAGTFKSPTLVYGDEIKMLMKSTFDVRQQFMLQYIVDERDAFTRVYTEKMASYQKIQNDVASVLADLPGISAKNVSGIEELLFRLAPKTPWIAKKE